MTDSGNALCARIVDHIAQTFVGQRVLLQKLLAGALANGHVLFEDHPGLGKTLLVKAFATTIGCGATRVQFTPDVLPADIVGTKVWDHRGGEFRLSKGPVFTHVLLADEINRSPPKTQSALLEAMEERQVTIEGETFRLPEPFFVLATQNPLEQEGTYPLPEAQLDRFLLRLSTGYPRDLAAETEILRRRVTWRKDDPTKDLRAVVTLDQFRGFQRDVEQVFIHDDLLQYIGRVVRGVRGHPAVMAGPSPRGALALLRAGRALAYIRGRDFTTPDDLKAFATEALAHRVILDMERSLEGVRAEEVVQEVVGSLPVPTRLREGDPGPAYAPEAPSEAPKPSLPAVLAAQARAGAAEEEPAQGLRERLRGVLPPAGRR